MILCKLLSVILKEKDKRVVKERKKEFQRRKKSKQEFKKRKKALKKSCFKVKK